MATKNYSAQDFQSIPVVGLVMESLASDPGSPTTSRFYFNSVSNKVKYYNGTAWVLLDNVPGASVIIDSMVSASAAIAESKLSLASDAASGTASRRTLGTSSTQAFPGNGRLDQLAVPTADVSLNSHKLTNVTDPSGAQDAATLTWTNAAIATAVNGQDWKAAVNATTTAALAANTYANGASGVGATLTANSNVALAAQDGVTLAVAQRLLVKDEATTSHNGIYVVTTVGSGATPYVLTRSTDANTGGAGVGISNGMTVAVDGGTVNNGTIWIQTTAGTIVVGTTAIVFAQIGAAGTSYTAGSGLTLTSNAFSITAPVSLANGGTNATSASAARTSLGVTGGLKYTATLGTITAATPLTVNHALSTSDVVVSIRDASTGANVVMDWGVTDANNITVTSAIGVTASALKIVVMG